MTDANWKRAWMDLLGRRLYADAHVVATTEDNQT